MEARLNGTLVYTTTAASLGTAGVQAIQIGNDTSAQAFGLYADTIAVDGVGDTTPSAPANVTLPTVSGTPQAGQTVTASTGTWTGSQPITYAYQWLRCDAASAACLAISGATSASYAVTAADVGDTLRVAVTASNGVGPSTATSNATAVVQGASTAPANTVAPTITGSAQAGQVLTARPGHLDGHPAHRLRLRVAALRQRRRDLRADQRGHEVLVHRRHRRRRQHAARRRHREQRGGERHGHVRGHRPGHRDQTQPGLVALWHMDETSGTSMFDAVGGHTGTLHSVSLGQPGSLGTAYGFTGSSYVSVPTKGDLNPGSANLTVTIRMKTTSAPATPDWDIIRKGLYTTAGGEWKMEYQPSGQASCGFKGSSGYSEMTAGPAINNGQWHTVQCVKTSTGIKVVVDGAATSKTAGIGAISNTDAVPIGARPGSEFFKGSLDEASVQIG